MARRAAVASVWAKAWQRNARSLLRRSVRAGSDAIERSTQGVVKAAVKQAVRQLRPPAGPGTWLGGTALGPAGLRHFRLYRPPGVRRGERRPLLVMLHGCAQDALASAHSTRLHRLAARERVFVLWPEQDLISHPQGCWNWFSTRTGQTQAEAATLLAAIDQVCLLHPVDRKRVAVAGLSAGASMAALLATGHPERFRAVVMHSGVPPGTAHSTATAIGAMTGHRAAAAPESPLRWPPLLVIHGDADPVVAPANGRAAAELWAGNAGARAGATRELQRGQRRAMSVTDYKAGGRVVATCCEVHGLGHAWSGGTARLLFGDPTGPDASRLLWTFVARRWRETGS